jgi:hypothetical protein
MESKQQIQAVIISYNLLTYVKKMVRQLEKYTDNIIVIDNKSTYQPLLDYFRNEYKYQLIQMDRNYGHEVYLLPMIQKQLNEIYILTDPDLLFNEKLPDNFIQTLINVSHYFQAKRVGFALDISRSDIREDIKHRDQNIVDWEKKHWNQRIDYPHNRSLELYVAPIDTTFCLINKKNHGPHIRIAGCFTCIHRPWHHDWLKDLLPDEYQHYSENNVSTTWAK